jgi:hypothetical protein
MRRAPGNYRLVDHLPIRVQNPATGVLGGSGYRSSSGAAMPVSRVTSANW